MAKKAIQAPRDELELRRWCIEQAMRWPMVGSPYQNQAVCGIYPSGMGQHEVDVVNRADRLLKWVNGR